MGSLTNIALICPGIAVILLGGIFLLADLFYCLYQKLIGEKKNNKTHLKGKEVIAEKFWFYNIALPCEIFCVCSIFVFWGFYLNLGNGFEMFLKWAFDIEGLFVIAAWGCVFGLFYLLYQLIYFLCTQFLRCTYYTSKRLWIISC